MKIVLLFAIVWLLSLLTQILFWRIRIPDRQVKALSTIFLANYLAFSMACLLVDGQPFSLSMMEFFHFSLAYMSLLGAYIMTYPALEIDSPSLLIVNYIRKHSESGVKAETIHSLFTNEVLLEPRIDGLLRDQYIIRENGVFKATRKGRWFASIFAFFRDKILHLNRLGG